MCTVWDIQSTGLEIWPQTQNILDKRPSANPWACWLTGSTALQSCLWPQAKHPLPGYTFILDIGLGNHLNHPFETSQVRTLNLRKDLPTITGGAPLWNLHVPGSKPMFLLSLFVLRMQQWCLSLLLFPLSHLACTKPATGWMQGTEISFSFKYLLNLSRALWNQMGFCLTTTAFLWPIPLPSVVTQHLSLPTDLPHTACLKNWIAKHQTA